METDRIEGLLYEHHSSGELYRIFAVSKDGDFAVARLSGFFAATMQDGCFHPARRFRLDDAALIAEVRRMLADAATYLNAAQKADLAQSLRAIERLSVVERQQVRSRIEAGNELHADHVDVLGDVSGRKRRAISGCSIRWTRPSIA